jgi:transglutaminase-like putative cysteine protease
MAVRRNMPPPPPMRRVASTNGHPDNAIAKANGNRHAEEHIDWANLSREDKDVLFSWLDEFFAAYFKRLGISHADFPTRSTPQGAKPTPPPMPARASRVLPTKATTPASTRPPLPVRKSTTEASPTVKHSVITPAPALPVRRPDISLQHRAESEPAPTGTATPRPPARRALPPPLKHTSKPQDIPAAPHINLSTKPTALIIHEHAVEADHGQVEECLRCRDYTAVDQHVTYFPRENVDSIHQLAWDLTSPFEHQFDKLRAITFWLHLNISYDAYSFLNHCVKPSTPDSTLRSGMAVCEGYAGLFSALALAVGLESIIVTGHGKGFGYAALAPGQPVPSYSAGHAWNAVKLDDGTWKLVDSCWAGGVLDNSGVFKRRWDSFHLVASNEEFLECHFPDPKEPWKQFVEPLRTWEEYITAVDTLPTLTGSFGEGEYARHLVYPNTKTIQAGRETFYIKKKCEHYREQEAEEYVHVMMGPSDAQEKRPGKAGWKSMTLDRTSGGWIYDGLRINRGEKVMIAVVTKIGGVDARGVGQAEYDRQMGKNTTEFLVLCQWEVE